jgi:putative transcriptional regulator
MPKTYNSPILAAIHETAQELASIGVMDKATMKEFDALCLTTVTPLSPAEICALRAREKASQAVFALHLNVTTGLISQWERGEKKPGGPALKLLHLVKRKGLRAVA